MQPAVLRALEFDRIREALAHEALTPLGRERADRLEPATDAGGRRAPAGIDVRGGRLRARRRHARDFGTRGSGAILEGLEIGQQPLEPLQLLGLARFVESVRAVADGSRDGGRCGNSAPGGPEFQIDLRPLRQIAEQVASFGDEVHAVRRAIHSSGDVNDDASPALRELRDTLRRQRGKLRSVLDRLTRGRDTAKYLQDQIVTDRNGRYVVVLRDGAS